MSKKNKSDDSDTPQSADELNATSNHPPDVSPERAAEIEREAGGNIARAGGELPDLATDAAREGYEAAKNEVQSDTDRNRESYEEGRAGRALFANPAAPAQPQIVHRALTRESLPKHAEAVSKAIYHLEKELAALSPEGEIPEGEQAVDYDALTDEQRGARVAEAQTYLGNAILSKPDGASFHQSLVWGVAQALRPWLLIRHRGNTAEV